MISWMVVLTIALFFALVAVKMIPTYLENYSIAQVLEGLQDERSVSDMSPGELKKTILKRFKINQVYNFDKDDIKITKKKKKLNVTVNYEVRKPIVGNVSVVMAFSESVDL